MGSIIRSNLKYILLILFIFLIWVYFPLIFMNLMTWMGWLGTDLKGYGEFGAIGDIYGSLNTFISSIALCAVAYSTYLQIKELRLTRQTYEDQLKESQYSNFSNLFYSLFNNKQVTYNNLTYKNNEVEFSAHEIFSKIGNEIVRLNYENWNEQLPEIDVVKKTFYDFTSSEIGPALIPQLTTYFSIYMDLLYLIEKSNLNDDDRNFFKRLISNSMTAYEQLSFLWIASFDRTFIEDMHDSQLIRLGYSNTLFPFMKKFFDVSCFCSTEIIRKWND